MPLPTGLFVESPEMEDVSRHQLSQNIDDWPEEVIQKLTDQHVKDIDEVLKKKEEELMSF